MSGLEGAEAAQCLALGPLPVDSSHCHRASGFTCLPPLSFELLESKHILALAWLNSRSSIKSSIKCMGALADPPQSSEVAIRTPARQKSKHQPGEHGGRLSAPRIVCLHSPEFLPAGGVCQDAMLFPEPSNPCTSPTQSRSAVQLQTHWTWGRKPESWLCC